MFFFWENHIEIAGLMREKARRSVSEFRLFAPDIFSKMLARQRGLGCSSPTATALAKRGGSDVPACASVAVAHRLSVR